MRLDRRPARSLALGLVLAVSALWTPGCAGTGESPRHEALEVRGTEPGDRLSGAFEVVSVHEEPIVTGGTRVTCRIRNLREHRTFKVQVRLDRVSSDSGLLVQSVEGGMDYLHHSEEIDIEVETPPDPRPVGSPPLKNRLVLTPL